MNVEELIGMSDNELAELVKERVAKLEGNDEMRQRFLSGHRALQHNIYVESVMLEIANDALIETMEGSKNA